MRLIEHLAAGAQQIVQVLRRDEFGGGVTQPIAERRVHAQDKAEVIGQQQAAGGVLE